MSILYQLANGKLITISVDDLLHMSDEDEQYLVGLNRGGSPSSPFFGSSISKGSGKTHHSNPYEKDGLDIEEDSDEVMGDEKFDINNIPDEDFSG